MKLEQNKQRSLTHTQMEGIIIQWLPEIVRIQLLWERTATL